MAKLVHCLCLVGYNSLTFGISSLIARKSYFDDIPLDNNTECFEMGTSMSFASHNDVEMVCICFNLLRDVQNLTDFRMESFLMKQSRKKKYHQGYLCSNLHVSS